MRPRKWQPGPLLLVVVLMLAAGVALTGAIAWRTFYGLGPSAPVAALTGATVVLALAALWAGRRTVFEFRASHAPACAVRRAVFEANGVRFELANTGSGPARRTSVRLWCAYTGTSIPSLEVRDTTIEGLGQAIAAGLQPHFETTITPLASSETTNEVARYGPRASDYEPAWSGGFGMVFWEAQASDLFGDVYPMSGYVVVDPEGLPAK